MALLGVAAALSVLVMYPATAAPLQDPNEGLGLLSSKSIVDTEMPVFSSNVQGDKVSSSLDRILTDTSILHTSTITRPSSTDFILMSTVTVISTPCTETSTAIGVPSHNSTILPTLAAEFASIFNLMLHLPTPTPKLKATHTKKPSPKVEAKIPQVSSPSVAPKCTGIWVPEDKDHNAVDLLVPSGVKLGPASAIDPGPPLRTVHAIDGYPANRGPEVADMWDNTCFPWTFRCGNSPELPDPFNKWACCSPEGAAVEPVDEYTDLKAYELGLEHKYMTTHPKHDKIYAAALKAHAEEKEKEAEKARKIVLEHLQQQQKDHQCMLTQLPNGTYIQTPWPKLEDLGFGDIHASVWQSVWKTHNYTANATAIGPNEIHNLEFNAHLKPPVPRGAHPAMRVNYGATYDRMRRSLDPITYFERRKELELLRMAGHLL